MSPCESEVHGICETLTHENPRSENVSYAFHCRFEFDWWFPIDRSAVSSAVLVLAGNSSIQRENTQIECMRFQKRSQVMFPGT